MARRRQGSFRALAPVAALCLLGLVVSPSAQAEGATAVGWGFDASGQLGNGTTGDPTCECAQAPVPVSRLSGVTQIATGTSHSVALLANGTVATWGNDESGQLGDGKTVPSPVPVMVPGLANVVAVAAANSYSLALLANGTVMAWGDNSAGQLGNGTTAGPDCGGLCSRVPVPVPGLANVVAIAAGNASLALLGDGTVVAWGPDNGGQAGELSVAQPGCNCVVRPTPVPGLSAAMAISSGQFGGFALLADGTVKGWGVNSAGQLGTGALTPRVPGGCGCLAPTSLGTFSGARLPAAGGADSLALLPNGSVQAWGENFFGQLGNGGTTSTGCSCIPAPGPVSALTAPLAVSAGDRHNLALLAGGSVEAWGFNHNGQLGDGSTEDRHVPTAVSGIGGASAVFAGRDDSFALIGPSQPLAVSFAGAGAGTVGGSGILCPSICEGRYPQGQVAILRAEAQAGGGFAGFSGACTGTGSCQARLDQGQAVTATFGVPKGTTITTAEISSRSKSASFSFTAPGAITGFECELIEPKPAHRRKRHRPKGHRRLERAGHSVPKPHFSPCTTPATQNHLLPGQYTFRVRALDILGADAQPAVKSFTIKRHKAKKKKKKH